MPTVGTYKMLGPGFSCCRVLDARMKTSWGLDPNSKQGGVVKVLPLECGGPGFRSLTNCVDLDPFLSS